jgi:hypothetical protein
MIVDEGGMGVSEVYGREFALPGVAEKGYGVSPRRDEWLYTGRKLIRSSFWVELYGTS